MAVCLFDHACQPDTSGSSMSLLGGIGFDVDTTHIDKLLGAPVLRVAAPLLSPTADGACSLLLTDAQVRYGHLYGVDIAYCDELLFGSLILNEQSLGCGLQEATAQAYQRIFAALDNKRFPLLQRVWNYLPAINRETDGLERYRQFNAGRLKAFMEGNRPIRGDVPPASAVGTSDSNLAFAFVASRKPLGALESPRQISAYLYPPEYGVCSPVFSRAGLATWHNTDTLLISGTAAIVGHSSLHPRDVVAQTQETIINLGAIVDKANAHTGSNRYCLSCLDFIVYLRYREHAKIVLDVLRQQVGDAPHVICVNADICRAELLVEIEAIGESRRCT